MREAASVTGAAEVATLETSPRPDFGALITSGNPETIRVPAPVITLKPPFDRWNYRVGVTTPEPIKIKDGTVTADLRFAGTGSPLAATGSVTFAGLPAGTSYAIGKLESGTWYLGDDSYVVAHLTGKFLGETSIQKFEGYFFGPPDQLTSTFSGQRPEDAELIRIAFSPGTKPLSSDIATLSIDLGPLVYNPQLAAEIAAKQEAQPSPPPPPHMP